MQYEMVWIGEEEISWFREISKEVRLEAGGVQRRWCSEQRSLVLTTRIDH